MKKAEIILVLKERLAASEAKLVRIRKCIRTASTPREALEKIALVLLGDK